MINFTKKMFAAMMLVMVSAVASAAVNFSIADVNIAPGKTATVAINMQNDAVVRSIQFDITLPAGLTADLTTVTATDRLTGYTVMPVKTLASGALRFAALAPLGGEGAAAGNGAIFTFDVTATDALAANAEIALSGTKATDATGTVEETTEVNGDVVKVNEKYTISGPEQVILIGENTAEVEIALANDGNLWGLQGTLTLPEGVTLAEGKASLAKTSRLASFDFVVNEKSAQEYTFIAATMVSTDPAVIHIAGTEGAILTLTLKGSDKAVDGSEIKLTNMKSTQADKSLVNLGNVTIKVVTKDANEEAYLKLNEEIAAIQKQLNDVVGDFPDQDLTEKTTPIQTDIDALKAELEAAHTAGTLTAESVLDAEKVKKITDAIEALKGELTAITTISANEAQGDIYTVGGVRVQKPVKGLNIINGKKVIK